MENVWENTVDQGAWGVRVERTGAYTGELVVEKLPEKTEVLREEVVLSYQAIFGPDVADLELWQRRALEVIDSQDTT